MELDPRIRGKLPQLSKIALENPCLIRDILTPQKHVLISPEQNTPLVNNHLNTDFHDRILNVPNNHIHVPVTMEGSPLPFIHPFSNISLSRSPTLPQSIKTNDFSREGFTNPITFKFERKTPLWTHDEDMKLVELVKEYEMQNWSKIAKSLKGKHAKQCYERWYNHLCPNIKKDPWTLEEDMILISSHQEVGYKWNEIAERLPGRTQNSIKNHWYGTKRRRSKKVRNDLIGINGNDGSLLHAYIKHVTVAEEAEKELQKKKKSETMLDGSSSGGFNSKGLVEDGESTSIMMEETHREMDFLEMLFA